MEFICLWYNIDNERGNSRELSGTAFEVQNESSKKKPLDKTSQMWYNKGGKGQPKASSKSRGTAHGSKVEMFTGCYFRNNTHTNTKRGTIMKKVLVSIQPVIHIHVRHDGTEDVVVHPLYNGTVWGAYLRVYDCTFDLCDEAGHIVYTGIVRNLHARASHERTFDGKYSEFRYSPIVDSYVGC